MSFGISFGASKSNSKGSEKTDNLVTQNQNQSGSQSTSGTTTTSGSTSQTGTTTGQQTQTSTGSQAQSGTTKGTGTQTTNLFSSDVLGGIEGAVKSLFTSLGGPARIDASSLNGFDPTAFVEGGMRSAEATTKSGLDQSIGGIKDAIGGNAGTNSAVALLQAKLHDEAAASLAGTRSQLTSTAQDIERNNLLAGNTINSTSNQLLSTLLDVLKGGTSSTSTAESQDTAQNSTNSSSARGTTAEQTAQNQTSQQTQTQQLIELMSQLLSGTTHTVGQTDTTGNVTKFGGGASASL